MLLKENKTPQYESIHILNSDRIPYPHEISVKINKQKKNCYSCAFQTKINRGVSKHHINTWGNVTLKKTWQHLRVFPLISS